MSARTDIDDPDPGDMWEDTLWGVGLTVGTLALLVLLMAVFGR
jgi:hypothetical protein